MHDIRHRVGIRAPVHTVYSAVATPDGIRAFWTNQVDGESSLGGRLGFYFGGPTPAAIAEVIELSPDELVRWRCVDGPAEWIDTTITFGVHDSGDEAVLLFTHGGWREPGEFMHHCSTKWATFLIGLRSGLEGGRFTAFPDDARISTGWR